jgi:myo-inositol-1(or 4)-monophosphatase
VTDAWLDTCRAAVADVRRVLEELPTRAVREPVVGAGMGGDDTTAIDAAVERAVIARLDALVDDYTIVSEEIGEVVKGNGAPRIVLDPIDGSLNAKRGLPHFALSVAVAEGETMDEVVFGYVFDFGSGEEWTARRGEGAWLNGEALGDERPKDRIEILAFEATLTSAIAERAAHVVGLAYRLRIMGSLAIALCSLAAGRLDGVCSLKPARSVDIAAAQLLVREVGLAIELFELPSFGESPLDLGAHSRLAAAATPELVAQLAAALQA